MATTSKNFSMRRTTLPANLRNLVDNLFTRDGSKIRPTMVGITLLRAEPASWTHSGLGCGNIAVNPAGEVFVGATEHWMGDDGESNWVGFSYSSAPVARAYENWNGKKVVNIQLPIPAPLFDSVAMDAPEQLAGAAEVLADAAFENAGQWADEARNAAEYDNAAVANKTSQWGRSVGGYAQSKRIAAAEAEYAAQEKADEVGEQEAQLRAAGWIS